MTNNAWCFLLGAYLLPAASADAQNMGRFDAQVRSGLDYLRMGKYDRAAAELEPVWEAGGNSPLVAENLAISYLNGEERRYQPERETKAFEMMTAAITKGGKATFLVAHSHERMTFLQGNRMTKFCAGRLSISPGRLVYVSESGDRPGEHSFDVKAEEIKEIEQSFDKGKGMFRFKAKPAASKKEIAMNLVPRTWTEKDAQFLILLVNRHVLGKESK